MDLTKPQMIAATNEVYRLTAIFFPCRSGSNAFWGASVSFMEDWTY
jgi:hypothetical protein